MITHVPIVDNGSVVLGRGECDGWMGETGRFVLVDVDDDVPCASTSAAPKNAPATTIALTRTIFPQVQFGFQTTKLRVELVTSDWVAARPLWVTEETEEIEGRRVETSALVERWELHVIYDRPAVILTCMCICICMCESYFCVVQ